MLGISKNHKGVLRKLTVIALVLMITSCSAVRGYLTDGTDGPDIYSFEKHAHDTIANGKSVFHFPVANSDGRCAERQERNAGCAYYSQRQHHI